MDTTKWKSVVIPLDIYKAVQKICELENRTISGQFRHMFESYCELKGYNIQKKETTVNEID